MWMLVALILQMVKRKADVMQQAAEPDEGDTEQQKPELAKAEEPEESTSDYSDEEEDSAGSDSEPDVSDEAGEDSPDEDPFDQIDVNFEFFDPKEQDFHGLKALLHTYLDGQQYDNSQLVDTIIAQSAVGTVVRTAEGEDPIGVMTVLNTQQHKQQPFMSQIKDFILSKCKDQEVKDKFSKTFDGPGCGLVINERLINCPPQLSPPLVQGLFDEIHWATEDQPQDRRDFFKFQQYVIMTRVYTDPLQQQTEAAAAARKLPAGPSKQPKKQKGEHQQQQVLVYVRPEDEFFHQHSSASYTFTIEGRAVGKEELQPLRLVMLLSADKVAKARAALDSVLDNPAARQ